MQWHASQQRLTRWVKMRFPFEVSFSIIVIRAMLGLTPPEWAYLATQRTSVRVDQGFARALDRKIRFAPLKPLKQSGVSTESVNALIEVACKLLRDGVPQVGNDKLHRLGKADTKYVEKSIRHLLNTAFRTP